MTSASAIAATARSVWLSGWRLGKFIRPAAIGGIVFGCVLMTAACSSSASSTSRAIPAGECGRARSAISSGGSARDQQPRQLGDGARVGLRRRGERQLRHPQRAVWSAMGRSCSSLSATSTTGPPRRRHRDLVRAHRRLGEVRQRHRRVVPLRVVAHHRRGILHAVHPLHARRPHRRVERVAEDDVDRHAIAPRVVDRHRRVLQPDRPVRHDRERLALDLGVAVRHRHRRLFVAAGRSTRASRCRRS